MYRVRIKNRLGASIAIRQVEEQQAGGTTATADTTAATTMAAIFSKVELLCYCADIDGETTCACYHGLLLLLLQLQLVMCSTNCIRILYRRVENSVSNQVPNKQYFYKL